MNHDHYDVIIIGSGAGGGTLAARLAPTGAKILILERGSFIPRERENWDWVSVFREGRYSTKEQWFDRNDAAFVPYTHYCVGGNTKVYGAALLRMREFDFGEVRHFEGVSPAWPISYLDLAPFYSQAERLYSAHGARKLDPHDPPSDDPYPHPPLAHEPRIENLYNDLKMLGYRPFPIPLGVRLEEKNHPQPPYRFSCFDGYPDLTEVKADAHVVSVNAALASSNVTLLTDANVEKLVTSPSGREVTGVHVIRHGERMTFTGGIVASACGAINSAALFLRSANDKHPDGLANSSGLVGRNLMTHNNGLFIAVSEVPNPSAFQKTFGMTDFYRGADDSELPLGTVQLMGKLDLDSLAALAKDVMPERPAQEISSHSIDFFVTAEDLPDPHNRVTLRPDGSIKVSYTENNLEAYRRLKDKLTQVLERVEDKYGRGGRSKYLHAKLGASGVSHQNGTLRFGHDRKTSVLDVNCRAHDVDNLYAVDSSFFVSSSAVNPSLTIMANALRVGDHIAARLKGATR